MNTEPSITETARIKIDRWNSAVNQLTRARREVSRLECELANARNEIGKFLVPSDFEGPFNIWFGNGILSATRANNDYTVEWLKKPTGKQAIEMDIQ